MKITKHKIIQVILLILSSIILFYTYYYLPNQNLGSIKTTNVEEIKTAEQIKTKNVFKNTEYINLDKEGKKYITKSKESYTLQNDKDLIYLNDVNTYTRIKKDNTILRIKSKKGLVDNKINETTYTDNVIITNKNYIITSNIAKHIAKKNLIIIDGNVIMKDLNNGLTHTIYCDTVEIDTTTNDAVAYMNDELKKVIGKKYK